MAERKWPSDDELNVLMGDFIRGITPDEPLVPILKAGTSSLADYPSLKEIREKSREDKVSEWFEKKHRDLDKRGYRKAPVEVPDAPTEPKVAPDSKYSQAELDGLSMIKLLAQQPFSNFTFLRKELGLTPARADKAPQWMLNSGIVRDVAITLTNKASQYFELLGDSYVTFGGKPLVGKGGFEHKCFCNRVKEFYEAKAYGVRLEGRVDGIDHPVDVLVWKKGTGEGMFCVEVTLSFENLVSNVRSCLASSLKRIIVVCSEKKESAKAKFILKEEFGGELPARIEFMTIQEFKVQSPDE